jgi:hypothetical protein
VQEAVLVAGEGGGRQNRVVPLIRFSDGNEQDNEIANVDVLERIQSQSCLESDTHCVKITNLLLEA